MLTKDEIRKAILNRLNAIDNNCNSTHRVHNSGAIRGLLWALTGEDPGTLSDGNSSRVMDLAGIPWHDVGNGVIEHATPGDADWPSD